MSSERDLIIAALTGDATEEDLRVLGGWRARSSENEAFYQEVLELWEAAGSAGFEAPAPPSAAEIIRAAERRAGADGGSVVSLA